MRPSVLPPLATSAPRRALIVDDEGPVRQVLRRWLERRGWQVREAASGDDALKLLGTDPDDPDLIICDLRMPGGTGATVWRWIDQNRPGLLQRFVLSSGNPGDAETLAIVAGARCHVLHKPFELAELASIVSRIARQTGENIVVRSV